MSDVLTIAVREVEHALALPLPTCRALPSDLLLYREQLRLAREWVAMAPEQPGFRELAVMLELVELKALALRALVEAGTGEAGLCAALRQLRYTHANALACCSRWGYRDQHESIRRVADTERGEIAA